MVDQISATATELERFLTTKTVIGEPMTIGEVTLVPIQAASFGFGGGVSEGGHEEKKGISANGVGRGAGAWLRPVAVLVIRGSEVEMIPFAKQGGLVNLANAIPDIIAKLQEAKAAKKDGKAATPAGEPAPEA